MEYFLIIISAIFVNNIVLAQFLGICPYLGVSSKLSTATGMSMAVCFVITLATLVTYLINTYLLVPLGITFLQTIAFILVIAALVQMVEIVLKKVSPSLYQALVYAFATSLGYGLAMVIFAGIREHLALNDVPKAFKGVPIAIISVGILALAFMGFSGMVK